MVLLPCRGPPRPAWIAFLGAYLAPFYIPYGLVNPKIGIFHDCRRTDCLYQNALKTYMEPSYLISTCCDWIAPVVGSRLGLMNT